MQLRIQTPRGFHFERTVRSHGWYALPPFSWDAQRRRLGLTVLLSGGRAIDCTIGPVKGGLLIRTGPDGSLDASGRRALRSIIRSCLRLDEDFTGFHAEARRHPEYRWIAASGAGRMLRAPTVFEDTVKMLCTTNCTWALTTLMVTNLVEAFGVRSGDNHAAFPSPSDLAGSSDAQLRREIKTGYRSPFLLALATDVASGHLAIEGWRSSALVTPALFAELVRLKGVGPYAAGNLLKLLGRYDYLGLDSWVRARYADLHAGGRRIGDRTIERRYRRFGEWRGLFFWLEMTRYWHDEKFGGTDRA